MVEATEKTKAPSKVAAQNTIKMKDGRIVDFAGKRRMQKETFISPEGHVSVRLDFVNGETRVFKPKQDMYTLYVGHGAGQKLVDEMAGIADLDDAINAVDELILHLNAGKWTQRREGGAVAGGSVLLRAMVEYTGKPVDVVRAFLSDKTAAEKAALRAAEIKNKAGHSIAGIVKRMEEEKAAKAPKVDTVALLSSI